MERLNTEDGGLFIKVSSVRMEAIPTDANLKRVTGELRSNARKGARQQPSNATAARQNRIHRQLDQPQLSNHAIHALVNLELLDDGFLLWGSQFHVPQYQTGSIDPHTPPSILYPFTVRRA